MAIGATAISLGLQGAKALAGGAQYLTGRKKMKGLERPEYEIPDELKQNLTAAQVQALQGMPAEQRNQFLQGLDRTQSSALASGANQGRGLAGAGSLADAQNQALLNLAATDAEIIGRNRDKVADARSVMAAAQDKAFQINKLDPYQQDLADAQANMGAGLQNVAGALDAGAAAVIGGADGDDSIDGSGSERTGDVDLDGVKSGLDAKKRQELDDMARKSGFSSVAEFLKFMNQSAGKALNIFR